MPGTPLVNSSAFMETRSASLQDRAGAWNEVLQGAQQAHGYIGGMPAYDGMMGAADGSLQSQAATGSKTADAKPTALEFINSQEVSKITKLSPTLTNGLKDLQADGWTIRWGKDEEKGTFSINLYKLIVLDPALAKSPEEFVSDLTHEVGHAKYNRIYPEDWSKPLPPREEFITNFVNTYLRNEGEATLTQLQVHDEILSAGGPKLPFRPEGGEAYQIMYQGYKNGVIRENQATVIGIFYGNNERPSSKPEKTYKEWYQDQAEELYDYLQNKQAQNISTHKQL
jgi:hypothetical protein